MVKKKVPVREYDRILRENFRDCNIGLLQQVLNAHTITPLPLSDKLSYTIEREGDRFFLIDPGNDEGKYIAHLEWQVKNDPRMPERMLLYHLLRYQQGRLPIKGFVIYVGDEPLRMKDRLEHFSLSYRYEIIDLHKFTPDFFLRSNEPEEVLFALLADTTTGEAKRKIVKEILYKLHHLMKSQPEELKKRIHQLEVLGKLRNAQKIIVEEVQHMATLYELYDLKTDLRYLEGKEDGIRIGKRGLRKAKREAKMEALIEAKVAAQQVLVRNLLSMTDHSDQYIAELAMVSVDFVVTLRAQMGKA